ncbi:MAG: aminotransferase class V-fold PLP-dependent enzyme [Actinomycetota bacterium]|nr:aminotransferase class V-fold PLP-dependent enzyme [Actinomycetota bacterium]
MAVRPLSDPIAPSSVFAFRDPEVADRRWAADPPEANYSRDGTPNVRTLERALADLEGADDAYAAASGMAAIALVFLSHLRSGDHVVVSADAYCETRSLLTEELAGFGVTSSFAAGSDPAAVAAAITDQTKLVYAETIANPSMTLADLPELAAVAAARGVLLCVDNTFATPALCRPIEHGADLVVHSATKFLGGHHDLTAGVVAGRRDLIRRIRRCGQLYGPTLGAMDAWLVLRGIRTLAPRIAWMSESARLVADYLIGHPAVARVRYPGSADQGEAALARRLLPNGAGGMLAFDLHGGAPATSAMIRGLAMIPFALSLGGTSTTVCYPPRASSVWTDGECGDELSGSATLRLSVGLEGPDDLIADLAQALAGVP